MTTSRSARGAGGRPPRSRSPRAARAAVAQLSSAARAPRRIELESGGSATLNGAGSTLAAPIYQQWGSNLKSQGLTVNYNPVGSGTGIADLQTATVDFAGSDPALKPTDIEGDEGPGAPVPGRVRRDHRVLQPVRGQERDSSSTGRRSPTSSWARSRPGTTRRSSALNPGLSLPSTAITVVHRSDSSGTTKGFTTFLSDVSPAWKSSVGAGEDVKWPIGTGAAKNSGVAAAIKQTTGAIGYVEQAYALENGFTYASVKNSGGTVRAADDREHVGGGGRDQGPAGPRDLDDQLAEPGRLPDRLADVPDRLQGSVQGRRRELSRWPAG